MLGTRLFSRNVYNSFLVLIQKIRQKPPPPCSFVTEKTLFIVCLVTLFLGQAAKMFICVSFITAGRLRRGAFLSHGFARKLTQQVANILGGLVDEGPQITLFGCKEDTYIHTCSSPLLKAGIVGGGGGGSQNVSPRSGHENNVLFKSHCVR